MEVILITQIIILIALIYTFRWLSDYNNQIEVILLSILKHHINLLKAFDKKEEDIIKDISNIMTVMSDAADIETIEIVKFKICNIKKQTEKLIKLSCSLLDMKKEGILI